MSTKHEKHHRYGGGIAYLLPDEFSRSSVTLTASSYAKTKFQYALCRIIKLSQNSSMWPCTKEKLIPYTVLTSPVDISWVTVPRLTQCSAFQRSKDAIIVLTLCSHFSSSDEIRCYC